MTRWVVAVALAIAGVVVVASGDWWGLAFFVGTVLNGLLAYLVPRWNPSRRMPNHAEPVG